MFEIDIWFSIFRLKVNTYLHSKAEKLTTVIYVRKKYANHRILGYQVIVLLRYASLGEIPSLWSSHKFNMFLIASLKVNPYSGDTIIMIIVISLCTALKICNDYYWESLNCWIDLVLMLHYYIYCMFWIRSRAICSYLHA